jgi:putative FmdB family regulatory protein
MPIYEYRCTNGHRFEVMQRMADEPIEACEVCGAPAVRVLHPVAIHFKGSGFYSTDYGRGKKVAADGRAESSSESKAKDGDSKSSDTKSSDSKSSDSKSASDSGKGASTKKAAEG